MRFSKIILFFSLIGGLYIMAMMIFTPQSEEELRGQDLIYYTYNKKPKGIEINDIVKGDPYYCINNILYYDFRRRSLILIRDKYTKEPLSCVIIDDKRDILGTAHYNIKVIE